MQFGKWREREKKKKAKESGEKNVTPLCPCAIVEATAAATATANESLEEEKVEMVEWKIYSTTTTHIHKEPCKRHNMSSLMNN